MSYFHLPQGTRVPPEQSSAQFRLESLVCGRGPLSLVNTSEELLRRNISGSGLEIENTAVRMSR
jgi:hypothetical protein